MTRFARKTTSRGTTKREPEEATPWSQMVAQVKQKNYDIEDEDDFMEGVEEGHDEASNRSPVAVRVGGNEEVDSDTEEEAQASMSKSEDGTRSEDDDSNEEEGDYGAMLEGEADEAHTRAAPTLISSEEPKKKKKKKRAEKCKICGSKEHIKMNCEMLSEERRKELQDLYNMKVGRAGMGTGRKKKKKKDKDKLPYEVEEATATVSTDETNTKQGDEKPKSQKSKKNKNKNKHHTSHKVIRDRSGAIVEKGEAIFHGFRVRKEDEKRLQTLCKELKAQGLTKTELEAAIKRERRIAEKSLARAKKLVCFQCRQPGHMLADCPQGGANSKTDEAEKGPTSGLCFKCGSLEHTSKECKLKRKGESAYNFASCFICKEEGHLAKACPDNPKGLYPRGGGCMFCGSVEHLKRDCPRKVEKDMSKGVRVATINNADLEDEPAHNYSPHAAKKRRKEPRPEKVVAF